MPDSSKTNSTDSVNDSGARRTHAQRSSAMKRKIIDAAIVCFDKYGYAQTSLQKITDEADVSRGAILHHFATRADVIEAVAESAALRQIKDINDYLKQHATTDNIYENLTYAAWWAMQKPSGMALLEVLIGACTDPEVDARVKARLEKIAEGEREGLWRAAEAFGLEDKQSMLKIGHLHRATMRGLLIEKRIAGDAYDEAAGMELLDYYRGMLSMKLKPDAGPQ